MYEYKVIEVLSHATPVLKALARELNEMGGEWRYVEMIRDSRHDNTWYVLIEREKELPDLKL
jgi:hypothetical protein